MGISKRIYLKMKSSKICITFDHFRYSTTETFGTFFVCPRNEKLIPQEDHLFKGCEYWQKKK